MTLSLKPLPVLEEKWDCQGCGHCCRGTTVALDDKDLETLADQAWDKHPDYLGVKTVVRAGPFSRHRVLARQADGRCIFLTDAGRCRIHEIHGPDAKPAICRMFPLQIVPLGGFAYLTTRRSCPSATVDEGRSLKEHLRGIKQSGLADRFSTPRRDPPPIVAGGRRSWTDFLIAADALARLMTDDRMPLVRRLVHALRFCSLLEECRVRRVPEDSWRDLIQCLEGSATDGAGEFFRDRQPPARTTAALFRLLAVHYLRSHPQFHPTGRLGERARMLWTMGRFARGRGRVPELHSEFPAATFEGLECPLGPLPGDVASPLDRYYETHTASKQYAVIGRRRPLVESFRGLAITYPIALWMLRLAASGREPSRADVVNIVVGLERGYGLSALHRGAAAMAGRGELERLIAWYAR